MCFDTASSLQRFAANRSLKPFSCPVLHISCCPCVQPDTQQPLLFSFGPGGVSGLQWRLRGNDDCNGHGRKRSWWRGDRGHLLFALSSTPEPLSFLPDGNGLFVCASGNAYDFMCWIHCIARWVWDACGDRECVELSPGSSGATSGSFGRMLAFFARGSSTTSSVACFFCLYAFALFQSWRSLGTTTGALSGVLIGVPWDTEYVMLEGQCCYRGCVAMKI